MKRSNTFFHNGFMFNLGHMNIINSTCKGDTVSLTIEANDDTGVSVMVMPYTATFEDDNMILQDVMGNRTTIKGTRVKYEVSQDE